MPSDPRVLQALDLFTGSIDRFRSAVVATLEEVRGALAVARGNGLDRAERLKTQLGPFADGRVDLSRLAAVLQGERGLDPGAERRLQAAYETLQDIASRGRDLFCVAVPAGTPLVTAVTAQLASIGRAFGAARVAASAHGVEAVIGMSDEHAMTRFGFQEWSSAERRLAPPLIVSVSGRDLNAGALTSVLDGSLKLLLIIDGPCAPVPLVRLITPNVFVMQAHEVEALKALDGWPGAGIGALMPPTGARFVHDPAAGPELWRRLIVTRSRDGHLSRIGGSSAAQQAEEILQLEALAARPSPEPAIPVSVPEVANTDDRIEQLTAWLLQQANLTQQGGHG
jgi:hypothetical protein